MVNDTSDSASATDPASMPNSTKEFRTIRITGAAGAAETERGIKQIKQEK